jgi:NAD+ kinase
MAETWTPGGLRPLIPGTTLIIAIGGDGAMLRASRVCADFDVPVLGINMGYLGFLTEIDAPDNWHRHMQDVIDGRYWIETRMMLNAEVWRGEQRIADMHALNDVVISRGTVTRMIRLDTYIDGDWTTTYNADALIIATATGSTAYALASGGPILPPEQRSILIVPVAPHLSLDRPIVLPEGARVEIVVSPAAQNETVLSADGMPGTNLLSADRVRVQSSDLVSRFARLRERNYFYRSLLDRLEPRKPSNEVRGTLSGDVQ